MMRPLYGLLLVGGQSSRMGTDKALLKYDSDKNQIERSVGILSVVCDEVFVSKRDEQRFVLPQGIGIVPDQLPDVKGPLCGILSAMNEMPEVDWLALACDLPNLKPEAFECLINHYRRNEPNLTAYRSTGDGLPEPLCAIYPSGFGQKLHQTANRLSTFSPRKLLIEMNATLLSLDDPHALENFNTPEEYSSRIAELK